MLWNNFSINIYLNLLKTVCSPVFQVPLSGTHVCLYSDGTRVTEKFFPTLPDNTELVLLTRGQTWTGGKWNDLTICLYVLSTRQTLEKTLLQSVCFGFQLFVTSVSYWVQIGTVKTSLKRQKAFSMMSIPQRGGKSWLTCCWTWRTGQNWRAERKMKTGSKVPVLLVVMMGLVYTIWKHEPCEIKSVSLSNVPLGANCSPVLSLWLTKFHLRYRSPIQD